MGVDTELGMGPEVGLGIGIGIGQRRPGHRRRVQAQGSGGNEERNGAPQRTQPVCRAAPGLRSYMMR